MVTDLDATAAPAAALWRHGADLLALIDAGGRITAVNPAFDAMLGRADAVGQRFADLLQPEDRPPAAAAFERTRALGRHTFTVRCLHRNGRALPIEWSAVCDGGVLHVIGRRHGLPEPQARSRRMLAMGRLTGGIAHDFNNLLQALRHALELLKLRPDDADAVRRWVDSALRIVDRGSRLTAQLMASAAAPRADAEPVAVKPLLDALAARLHALAAPGVDVVVEPDVDAGNVLVDRALLDGALLNLGRNAAEAMPGGGTLTLGSARVLLAGDAELPSGEYVRISVADTGAGMSDTVRERAFEPFFTTKPISEGAGRGLGLAQVHGFGRRYGGSARIAASGGGGTTMHLLLPALALPAPPQRDTVVVVAAVEGELRRSLCDHLRLLGYRSLPVADADGALAAVIRHRAAALLVAPGRDWDAAALAREADAAVIVLDGDGSGGSEALPRPFDLPSLSSAIERAVARRAAV